MNMPLIISLATFVSTAIGGLLALRFKDKLHLILGFSAGALLAVAFFDLLPEALNLGGQTYDSLSVFTVLAGGFVSYMILDRLFLMHGHDEHDHGANRGRFGATSLAIHSFLDGAAIGLAFQVSGSVGAVVATAVLIHDFSDGINTVSIVLKNYGKRREALGWLIADAIAPVFGVLSTLLFKLSESSLGLILALFAGFFLYIGASDLLPESHHNHPTFLTTIMTIIGMAILYIAIKLAAF